MPPTENEEPKPVELSQRLTPEELQLMPLPELLSLKNELLEEARQRALYFKEINVAIREARRAESRRG